MNSNTTSNQLELGFQNRGQASASKTRVIVRRRRATVWFNRMRQVVERTIDRTPAPTPRPEQTWLPSANPLPQHHLAE
jgi:hypothetical protein